MAAGGLSDPVLLRCLEGAAVALERERPADATQWLAERFAALAGPPPVTHPSDVSPDWLSRCLLAGALRRDPGAEPSAARRDAYGAAPRVRRAAVERTLGRNSYRIVADHDGWAGHPPRALVLKLRRAARCGAPAGSARRLWECELEALPHCRPRLPAPALCWTGADCPGGGRGGPGVLNVLEEDLGAARGGEPPACGAELAALARLHAPFLRRPQLLPSWGPLAPSSAPAAVGPLWCWAEPGGIYGPPAEPQQWAPGELGRMAEGLVLRLPGLMAEKRYCSGLQTVVHGSPCSSSFLPVDGGEYALTDWVHAFVGNAAADLAHLCVLQGAAPQPPGSSARGPCAAAAARAAVREALPWLGMWRDMLRRYHTELRREGAEVSEPELLHAFRVAAAATLLWRLRRACTELFDSWAPALRRWFSDAPGGDAERQAAALREWAADPGGSTAASCGLQPLVEALESYAAEPVEIRRPDGSVWHRLSGLCLAGAEHSAEDAPPPEPAGAPLSGAAAAEALLERRGEAAAAACCLPDGRLFDSADVAALELLPGAELVVRELPAPELRLVHAGQLGVIDLFGEALRDIAAPLL
eukprot:TRINITY_DN60529_c0_g1_i1.p1 TRINITY_DN60529_c0_g1~~TRINITY_DN60529_c0_g1_i1.p1  ORF type:complete len:612 (+),score=171.84 TRINITY_DN60529_c0_g1_i1:77-1837(+)